jgi:hypothetical protein
MSNPEDFTKGFLWRFGFILILDGGIYAICHESNGNSAYGGPEVFEQATPNSTAGAESGSEKV